MTSPAERYAAARRRQAASHTHLAQFQQAFDFPFDDFQLQACQALEAGEGVLVAAPTGAGKTIVGEFAVYLGLAQGTKTFYTTPIKALSNQKYADLCARYGRERVGLLTGDTSVNPHAQVVVMTTEVLRNMIYADSRDIDRLGYVVMDEVHYLADRFRGPVWEEVMIHLDPAVRVVSLSATVSNAEEFGAWLGHVRGNTAVIVSEHRPVPLTQHMMVGGKLFDLYSRPVELDSARAQADHAGAPALNPDLLSALQSAKRAAAATLSTASGRQGSNKARKKAWRAAHMRSKGAGGRLRPPSRVKVVRTLAEAGLLPAIVFIFSRQRCDEAVHHLLMADVVLTSQTEAVRIRRIIDERTSDIPPHDLAVLGFDRWAQALENGYAAHHAGLLPLFKEIIEELFSAGLIKVVYATETLALGINMPARTVVLESLRKWDGSAHVPLTPGQYTQLTGRAGRRGIDTEGHAVVIAADDAEPSFVSSLASRRTYPLTSAFRPTYNMAVNLLSRASRTRTREILETSFAQFQADRSVVELAAQARRMRRSTDELTAQMACHLGDFQEYALLRQRLSEAEADLSRRRRADRRLEAIRHMAQLDPGDVVIYRKGRRRQHGVVLDAGHDRSGTAYLIVLAENGDLTTITADTTPEGVLGVGHLRAPDHLLKPATMRQPRNREKLRSILLTALRSGELHESQESQGTDGTASAITKGSGKQKTNLTQQIEQLRQQLRAHPCHGCADREVHARVGRQWAKARAQADRLQARVESRTGTVARQFDAVCQVLIELGYLVPRDPRHSEGELRVTPAGHLLRRIYTERDLLIAQCIRHGVWDQLSSDELAGAVVACIYENRPGMGRLGSPVSPGSALGRALSEQHRLATALYSLEVLAHLQPGSGSEPAVSGAIARWAAGDALTDVLDAADIPPGDFVRTAKQLLDVLGQLAVLSRATLGPAAQQADWQAQEDDLAYRLPHLARSAAQAAIDVERGVVAWSNLPAQPDSRGGEGE